MRLYVWEDVFRDYTAGIAFALASSEDEARAMLLRRLRDNGDHYCAGDILGPPTRVEDGPASGYVRGGG